MDDKDKHIAELTADKKTLIEQRNSAFDAMSARDKHIDELASKWESKAQEYTDRINELTYGNRSVGEIDATIMILHNHAKELRELLGKKP